MNMRQISNRLLSTVAGRPLVLSQLPSNRRYGSRLLLLCILTCMYSLWVILVWARPERSWLRHGSIESSLSRTLRRLLCQWRAGRRSVLSRPVQRGARRGAGGPLFPHCSTDYIARRFATVLGGRFDSIGGWGLACISGCHLTGPNSPTSRLK